MIPRTLTTFALSCLLLLPAMADDAPSRLQVLFFGAPTANHPGHDPITRYEILKKRLGVEGIDLTYTENPAEAFQPRTLSSYDVLLMYGNWDQDGPLQESREKALLDFVESGHGFVPVHCASACYGGSEAFVHLVGARFQSHGWDKFRPRTVAPNNPIMKGYQGFEAQDESYVHDRQGDDRTILQVRGEEPWTWTRQQGKGRVFYTASGHDHQVWDLPEFADLLRRGILWAAGPEARQRLAALKLPRPGMRKVQLPGYRDGKLVTEVPEPLSPADSMRMAQVPVGFRFSLFAAEPDIVKPISIAWDERGRAWVLESVDYPNELQPENKGNDRLTICEDTNGDGRADKFTRFAENLSIPTTLVFHQGGVLCTNGTDVLYLKDTNGDDRADLRLVLFRGINMGDTHAAVSNFRLGADNWIYATVGYSGFDGMVGGKRHRFSTGLFRFRVNLPENPKPGADGTLQEYCEMEFLQNTTNNTWGLGFTKEFEIMGSTANANPSWFYTISNESYEQAGMSPVKTPRADHNPKFFPSSMDIRQVDVFDGYTAAAGHAFYTATRFPEDWQNLSAFICEPTAKLIGRFDIRRNGTGFVAVQSPNNLFNSADAWTSPVWAEVGPDGAVWFGDWYNPVIQHNPTPTRANSGLDAKTGKGNAYVTPYRDKAHGRIYRIFPRGSANDISPDNLAIGLTHPNWFWRMTSQRLLSDAGGSQYDSQLRDLVSKPGNLPGSLHAFGILQSSGKMTPELVRAALASGEAPLQRMALAVVDTEEVLASLLNPAGGDSALDAMTRKDLYLAISRLAPSPRLAHFLASELKQRSWELPLGGADSALLDSWQIAARHNAAGVLAALGEAGKATVESPNLLPNPDFAQADGDKPAGWTDLRVYGGQGSDATLRRVEGAGRNGGAALEISTTSNVDCGAAAVLPVEPNSRYELSAWIKTRDVHSGGEGCMVNVHGMGHSRGLKGTHDWTRVSMQLDSGNRRDIIVHCLFGGYGGAVGQAWWSDVSLVKIGGGDPVSIARSQLEAWSPDAVVEVKPRTHAVDEAVHARGQKVFDLTCVACHGADGQGVEGAFPPLDKSPWVLGDPVKPVKIVLHGLQGPVQVNGKSYDSLMAPLSHLSDQEVADVLTYVRQSWDNDAAAVAPETVKKVRAETAGRQEPYTLEQLDRP